MSPSMGDLDEDSIQAELHTDALGRSLQLLTEVASTNEVAKQAAEQGAPHGHTIVADAQSQGRGSHGRVWSSPGGTDLYVSILLRFGLKAVQLAPMTLAAGVAVAETVEAFVPLQAAIKWPNDVWLQGKKCAGLLAETSSQKGTTNAVVLGIGINVNRTHFEPELATHATSMRLAHPASATCNRSLVLAQLLNRTEHWLKLYNDHGLEPALGTLRAKLALKDSWVRCGAAQGRIIDVANDGALILQDSRTVHTLYAGTLEACPKPTCD